MRIVTLDKAKPGMIVGKSIYGSNGQVLLREGIYLTQEYIKLLENFAVYSLYIKKGLNDDVIAEDIVSERNRLEAVKITKEVVNNIKLGSGFDSRAVKAVINNLIDDLLSNPNLVINLAEIRSVNDYMVGHCVNVAVLSVVVGIALNYDQIKLRNLAIGAMFHDIGKIKLPAEIVNKKDKLTEEEEAEFRKHTVYGFEILRAKADINLLSAHVALQHHEWFDGTGYPRGLKGEEIHEFARIVSITQCYDWLINDTPKRLRFSPDEAVESLIMRCGNQLDTDLVRLFLNSIAIYPVGTEVVLNTGEKGVVVAVHKNFPTRPVVRITQNQLGTTIQPGYKIDLLTKTTYFITRILEDNLDQDGEEENLGPVTEGAKLHDI